jgi:hypothetical protein
MAKQEDPEARAELVGSAVGQVPEEPARQALPARTPVGQVARAGQVGQVVRAGPAARTPVGPAARAPLARAGRAARPPARTPATATMATHAPTTPVMPVSVRTLRAPRERRATTPIYATDKRPVVKLGSASQAPHRRSVTMTYAPSTPATRRPVYSTRPSASMTATLARSTRVIRAVAHPTHRSTSTMAIAVRWTRAIRRRVFRMNLRARSINAV